MNVYDFDNTIYDGDSSIDFYFFCLHVHPRIITCMFSQVYGVGQYVLNKINTKRMKEYFFSFLQKMSDTDILIESFWDRHQRKIKHWYLRQKCETDVIISASPDFLLEHICKRLNISAPIATKMDMYTGKIIGENCKGEEKVRRYYMQYSNEKIEKFYSESQNDAPLANIAKEAFRVRADSLYSWRQ